MSFKDIEVGSLYRINDVEYIVLAKSDNSALCLTRRLLERGVFDEDKNNYATSQIKRYLEDEFLPTIINCVGESNLYDIELDLTSDDGLDDYGKVTSKIGLLTCEMYRKYNRIIERYPVDDYWWTATPFSTEHRGYSSYVRVVRSDGTLNRSNCYFSFGVRPFCVFSSSVFDDEN